VQLLPPSRFRFTDDADVAAYGDGWWTWDEAALLALPGRDLIALEAAVGMPVAGVIDSFHRRETLGIMAAQWIALHRASHPVKWDDFNPITLAAEWDEVPPAPLDSGESPPTPSPSSTGLSEESATSC
jgi:hypothetical protein